MATEIEINTILNTDRSEQGLSQLRKGLKELISLQGQVGAGSDQFKKLQKAINETEGQIGDLTDSFQTLKGSGVERLNSSLGLLREGFLTADPGKLKFAMEGLGAAMKAIPIFLLLEGVKLLYENFDKVVQVFKKLDPAFQKQIQQTKDLTDANTDLEYALKGVLSYYDRQIKLSQAAGSDQISILELQVQKYDELEKSLSKTADNYIKLYQLGGEGAQGYYEKALEFETKAKDAAYEGAAVLLQIDEVNRKRKEENAKEAARLDREETERLLNRAKLNRSIADAGQAAADANNKEFEAQQKADRDKELADAMFTISQDKAIAEERAAILKSIDDQEKENRLKNDREVIAEQIKNWQLEEAEARRIADIKEKINDNYTEAILQTGSLFIQLEENKLRTETNRINTALQNDKLTTKERYALQLELYNKETEAKKKQFKIDKAFKLAGAVIDGARAVLSALNVQPYPVGVALAASAAAISAVNIAKIASSKFDAGVAPSAPSGGGGSLLADTSVGGPTQQVPTSGSNAFNPTGINNSQGSNREVNRVYVLESDIRNITNKVNVIESRATFP